MLGYHFYRQKPINNFIVDFYCTNLLLAIEIDGMTHNYKYSQDKERKKRLEDLGIHVLRFREVDVRDNLEGVLMNIKSWIEVHAVM